MSSTIITPPAKHPLWEWLSGNSNRPTKWEYMGYSMPAAAGTADQAAINADINALGAAGWELVCIAGYYLYFKRPLQT